MSVRIEFVAEQAQPYDGQVQFYVSNKAAQTFSVVVETCRSDVRDDESVAIGCFVQAGLCFQCGTDAAADHKRDGL